MGMKLPANVERQVLALAGLRPARAETEAEFQARVVELAEVFGWTCYHTFDSRKSGDGFPDLVLSRPRRTPAMVVAELKVGRNKPTLEQLDWLDRFRAAGIPAFVWFPEDWAEIERTLMGES